MINKNKTHNKRRRTQSKKEKLKMLVKCTVDIHSMNWFYGQTHSMNRMNMWINNVWNNIVEDLLFAWHIQNCKSKTRKSKQTNHLPQNFQLNFYFCWLFAFIIFNRVLIVLLPESMNATNNMSLFFYFVYLFIEMIVFAFLLYHNGLLNVRFK